MVIGSRKDAMHCVSTILFVLPVYMSFRMIRRTYQRAAFDIRESAFHAFHPVFFEQFWSNVFLNRKKNIGRKAEEALIVWLIESNRLTSKERMFEVYMNIIELGPNVYGIGEASRFYFNKRPIQLNLEESIFLASLLPHPKWFRYSFDQSGQLKPYLADYYRVMSNFMLRKNLITQEEHDKLLPQVTITGPAKESIIITTDTIQAPPQEELEIDNQIN